MHLSPNPDDAQQVLVHEAPENCTQLRICVNGAFTRAIDAGPTPRGVNLLDALMDVGHLVPPEGDVILTVVALDAQRQPLAEADLSVTLPASRIGCPAPPVGTGARLLAAALRRSGERHTWRLRPVDAVRVVGGHQSHPVSGYHVYLRLVAEFGSSDARVDVTWNSAERSPALSRKRNREGCLRGEITWGSTTCTARLLGDDTNDSVFLCFVPDIDDETVIECQVSRTDPTSYPSPTSVRYAVHAHAQPCAALPGALLTPVINSTPPPSSAVHQPGRRRAVLVGVSKYSRRPRGDLEWCDEDATAWYRYLTARGFECRIFGDEFSPYPRWDGPATVGNVRRAVQAMVQAASQPEDRVVFVDSSHGNGDGNGASYLCLLPETGATDKDEREGKYWDRHLATDLSGGRAATFVFLDACFSGGILQELVDQLPTSFGTSTCTQKGYGYDESMSAHGAWTETFLVEGLERTQGRENLDMVALFEKALQSYTQRHTARGDRPCCFLSVNGRKYNTNDAAGVPLPRATLHLDDIL